MNDIDRELLELAAKAAGLTLTYCPAWGCMAKELQDSKGKYFDAKTCWRPLTDDGDALRLAVKLRLDVGSGFNLHGVEVCMVSHAELFSGCFEEAYGNDPCAATRRAIVRAAAEIGRNRGYVVTDKQTEELRSLYDITGDVTDKDTVLVGRAEFHRLHAEITNQKDWLVEWGKWEQEAKGLRKQRDELLTALQKLHRTLDESSMLHDDQRTAYANAGAAITKATGEEAV